MAIPGMTLITLGAVITKLLDASALTAVVSTRIAPPGPKNKTEPYVAVSKARDRTRHGLTYNEPDSAEFSVNIEGWATDYTAAAQLMSLIEAATEGEMVTVTGWGTCRMEGSGGPVKPYVENDVWHFHGTRRVKLLLVNQSTS